MLHPKEFAKALDQWLHEFCQSLRSKEEIVAIGKSLRGAKEGAGGSCSHLVYAYASVARLVLSQVRSESKNKWDAMLKLIGSLELEGTVVVGRCGLPEEGSQSDSEQKGG